MTIFRIEHQDTSKGMWQTLTPEGAPMVTLLTNEVMATMPMPFSPVYGENGRRWYSAGGSLEQLYMWFNPQDLQELIDLGFEIFEVEATEWKDLGQEVIFTKESVIMMENVTHRFVLVAVTE